MIVALLLVGSIFYILDQREATIETIPSLVEFEVFNPTQKGKKKTPEERALFDEARLMHEYYRQLNPLTGEVPLEAKIEEVNMSYQAPNTFAGRVPSATYTSRGPSNLGGRTRALAVDISDNTGNTMLAGGVSGGLYRTTDGGATWTKVSANNEIHNVTCIVQDPRAGNQNRWYYGTGESLGNSASFNGAFFFGQGIWESTDSGQTWSQIANTASTQESFDSRFDLVTNLAVNPTNGDVLAALAGRVSRYNGSTWTTELNNPSGSSTFVSDVVYTSTGRAYASFSGNQTSTIAGVWTSATGSGGWTRIAQTNTPPNWSAVGRIVLALAPSNNDILYALYANGNGGAIEADLWRYDNNLLTWTDYSSKLPDEGTTNLAGNDPFAIQGGYDLVVSVKPDDQDFVVIGGTNAYKIADIVNDATFTRIGGYRNELSYALYDSGGGDTHHPDIHALVFNPFNTSVLFTGTDGGIHRTDNINAATVAWNNINNDYRTYQYYHVAMDPLNGSDGVIGGAQDNGTTAGGTTFGLADATTMALILGGDGVAVGISRDNACVPFFEGFQNGTLFRTCPTFTNITPSGSGSQFVTYFYLDPDNNNALYYAGLNTLYRTTASTTVTSGTWTNMGSTSTITGTPTDRIQAMATTRGTYNAATSYLMIGGDRGGIYRLDDPQNAANISSAVDITPAGVTRTFPYICTGIAIHPTNPDIAMVTYANYGVNNIYVTSNATAASPTWTLVERNLASFSIRSAAIAEVAGDVFYYVGTARGLYATTDPTSVDWTIQSPNDIGFAVISSMAYRPSDNKLLIGTHGNGMYEASIFSLSSESFTENGDLNYYPNPVVSDINLVIEDQILANNPKYQVLDLTGKQVLNGSLDNQKVINVDGLSPGLYFVQLAANNQKFTAKFVKK